MGDEFYCDWYLNSVTRLPSGTRNKCMKKTISPIPELLLSQAIYKFLIKKMFYKTTNCL